MKDIRTNEIKEFKKIHELAEYLNISPSTITACMKKYPSILSNFVQIKWTWDDRPWVSMLDLYQKYNKTNKRKCIETVNIKTGKKDIYISGAACARAKNILNTTLNNRLKSNGKTIFSDNCTYKYC